MFRRWHRRARLPEPQPITVFVHSHNRPVYLWASLDSLYRGTAYPHRFVFIDFWAVLWERLPTIGPYLAHIETDVIVEATDPCWLSRLAALMDANPRLAMLGAAIDTRDFVSLDEARRIEPTADEGRLRNLIKSHSPERGQDRSLRPGQSIFSPYNPPGRILLVRTEALAKVGAGDDGGLHRKFIEAGYQTGIAAGVRHRHLSLLHIYDYPEYDYVRRDAYVSGPV
jgi:hypothetical protein